MAAVPIAVDAMGGDHAPSSVLEGVSEALDRFGDAYRLLLAGDPGVIESGLRRLGKWGDPRVEVCPAEEVIGMDEHPAQAVRSKRRSSINVAADLVKRRQAVGLFSAGNTGATVGASYLKWRMLPGLDRPGIAAVLPSFSGGSFILMDSGATVDCSPANLVQFAVMGDIYARRILGIAAPRVGLLCNGTEEGKGNRQVSEAFPLLGQVKDLDFIGNVEGHDLFSDRVDVVVCDGFVGNVVLKSCEKLARTLIGTIRGRIVSRPLWKFGGLLARGAFRDIKAQVDPSECGGAPLLGVDGVCLIGHGVADAKAVANGIRAVGAMIRENLNDAIVEKVHQCGLDSLR